MPIEVPVWTKVDGTPIRGMLMGNALVVGVVCFRGIVFLERASSPICHLESVVLMIQNTPLASWLFPVPSFPFGRGTNKHFNGAVFFTIDCIYEPDHVYLDQTIRNAYLATKNIIKLYFHLLVILYFGMQ